MRTKPPIRTADKAMNISTRQPARRPLGPTKICFNPNVGRELGRKYSVDNTGKFSATPSLDLQRSFFSPSMLFRIGPVIKKSKAPDVESVGRICASSFLSCPYSGSLRWVENLTKNLAACKKSWLKPVWHKVVSTFGETAREFRNRFLLLLQRRPGLPFNSRFVAPR